MSLMTFLMISLLPTHLGGCAACNAFSEEFARRQERSQWNKPHHASRSPASAAIAAGKG